MLSLRSMCTNRTFLPCWFASLVDLALCFARIFINNDEEAKIYHDGSDEKDFGRKRFRFRS